MALTRIAGVAGAPADPRSIRRQDRASMPCVGEPLLLVRVPQHPEGGMSMAAELALRVERVVAAPPEVVFRMHVEPDLFARWFGPKGFSVTVVDFDVRVGGGYRVTMQPPDADAFVLFGEFREIDRGARLAYTFRYESPDPDDRDTVVALSFRGLGEATVLTVEQGLFATEARRALHQQGWTDSLDRLEDLLESRDLATPSDETTA